MSSQNQHITWETIRIWVVSIVVPLIGLLFTAVIFGIRIDDKLTHITQRQDKTDLQMEGLGKDINGVKTKVDTIERRQAIYQATHR